MSTIPAKGHIDKIAIGLSALCAVHCLILPLIAGLLPALAALTGSHVHFHTLMLVAVLPLSSFALGAGWLRHRDAAVLALGLTGLILIVVAATVGHDLPSEAAERWTTVAGSLLLALAHLRNYRQCRPSDGCHKGPCQSRC
ncbi:MAG: MerC domain-containing protein [Candidatus Hydrogenedentes bacterium]|nr:MerC domain-containing protein [Candidatus Hydrogenedentota bacterium]